MYIYVYMYATVPLTGSFPKWNWEVESCQLACLLVFRGKVAGLPPLFFCHVDARAALIPKQLRCGSHHIQSQQKTSRDPSHLTSDQVYTEKNKYIYICICFFPKCLFPDLIVWYFLMGARFLFNTFLMHVSHQDKMISQFFLYLKTNQRRLRGALLSWRYIGTWGWTVWGKIRKGKKSSCSEKSSSEKSSVESQKGHVVAHGHVVALEGRACAWACASLREACARFCPWFAKIICSPVSGTCLAEQSKPCANLAQTLRCLAVLLHLVGGPLLKENVKHANGTQMSRWSFFACYTFLESAHMLDLAKL